MRGRALLYLSMAAQSRAFLIASSVASTGPLRAVCRSPAAARTSAAPPLMAYDVKYSPNRWRDEGDIVPSFGGIWPGDPDAETHHVRVAQWLSGRSRPLVLVPVDACNCVLLSQQQVLGHKLNCARRRERMCRNLALYRESSFNRNIAECTYIQHTTFFGKFDCLQESGCVCTA